MASVTLDFDNAREAQQLFDNNPKNLRLLNEAFGVNATARDGWIKIEGEEVAITKARQVFDALREQLDAGNRPRLREFLKTIETISENGHDALRSLNEQRITTSPRKPQVVPKTLGQKNYLQAITAHDITFGIGPAGTGKTYLAMAKAVSALHYGEVKPHHSHAPRSGGGRGARVFAGRLARKTQPVSPPVA